MSREEGKLSNWRVLKEAALELSKGGATVFTRKELVERAISIDPSKPASSLDFEVDLVTVNGVSKDKYKDPEKLFLFRVGRGKYTLYDPEIHGPIEDYIPSILPPHRKSIAKSIAEALRSRGFTIDERTSTRPTSPDLIAVGSSGSIGIWIVDPSGDLKAQLRSMAHALGSAIIERRNYSEAIVAIPPTLASHVDAKLREYLESWNVRIVAFREERRYTLGL
ncbi:MAG: hypothetical protein QXV30_00785 [Desulfurococcaceae archaeon]